MVFSKVVLSLLIFCWVVGFVVLGFCVGVDFGLCLVCVLWVEVLLFLCMVSLMCLWVMFILVMWILIILLIFMILLGFFMKWLVNWLIWIRLFWCMLILMKVLKVVIFVIVFFSVMLGCRFLMFLILLVKLVVMKLGCGLWLGFFSFDRMLWIVGRLKLLLIKVLVWMDFSVLLLFMICWMLCL